MKQVNCWKGKEGELFFDSSSCIWTFVCDSRKITIISWADTQKGPMTELTILSAGKKIIIEVIERKFNTELYSPVKAEESAKKVLELCSVLSSIDMTSVPYWMILSLHPRIEEVAKQFVRAKSIHAYYGNGLFFGIKINLFGKVKRLDSIPGRCMEFPGTRLDSIVD